MGDESVCLDSPTVEDTVESTVRFQACNELDRQRFTFEPKTGRLTHKESGKCVMKASFFCATQSRKLLALLFGNIDFGPIYIRMVSKNEICNRKIIK